MKKRATILGIETSCDETAVAIVECTQQKEGYRCNVLTNLVHSQIPIHRKTGGVVPEIAAREHAIRLPLLLQKIGEKFGQKRLEREVDAIAVTVGPGLVTSLLVGVEVARTIADAWQKLLIPINHLEGHIYANLLPSSRLQNKNYELQNFAFPLLALIVSGGHTELVLMKNHLNYKLLGSTRDDAVGEAFDKVAKLLGLPYPGGPELATLAKKGDKNAINFPRPMLNQANLDFSFSGIKTAVAVYLQKHSTAKKANVAASFETAVVETLVEKTAWAAKMYHPKMILLAGGVAANKQLRQNLKKHFRLHFPEINILQPALKFSTDNAAMIAVAGAIRFLRQQKIEKISVKPHLPLI